MLERFQDTVFERAFDIAELAHLSEQERATYEYSLKIYRDNVNVLNSATERARNEGLAEGERKAKIQLAQQMKADGLRVEKIALYTGLSVEDIERV